MLTMRQSDDAQGAEGGGGGKEARGKTSPPPPPTPTPSVSVTRVTNEKQRKTKQNKTNRKKEVKSQTIERDGPPACEQRRDKCRPAYAQKMVQWGCMYGERGHTRVVE